MKPNIDPNVPSILQTNRTEIPSKPEPSSAPEKPSRRQILRQVGIVALVIVVLAGIFIGGGLLSERQHQAQLKKEAARAQRENSPVFSNDTEPEFRDDELTTFVSEAYYSAENGMMVSLSFANGTESEQRITQVEITLKNEEGKIIASSVSDTIRDYTIVAGNTGTLSVYLPPEAVRISDDPLSLLVSDITAHYAPVTS